MALKRAEKIGRLSFWLATEAAVAAEVAGKLKVLLVMQ